ncbi:hypothetical protein AVEN_252784-1, partial [Araneus ventricosus]
FANEHHIPKTALNEILSSKQVIEEADCKDKRKRMRKSKFDEIEEVFSSMSKTCQIAKRANFYLDFSKKKALEIAEELNVEDFGGSSGCMERFKYRHCPSLKTICGEAEAVEGEAIEDW